MKMQIKHQTIVEGLTPEGEPIFNANFYEEFAGNTAADILRATIEKMADITIEEDRASPVLSYCLTEWCMDNRQHTDLWFVYRGFADGQFLGILKIQKRTVVPDISESEYEEDIGLNESIQASDNLYSPDFNHLAIDSVNWL
jgi:hypothetical protein